MIPLRGGWRVQAIYAVAFAGGAIWCHAHDAEPWYVACVAGAIGCATAAWHCLLFRVLRAAVIRHGVQGDVLEALNIWKQARRRARAHRARSPEDHRAGR